MFMNFNGQKVDMKKFVKIEKWDYTINYKERFCIVGYPNWKLRMNEAQYFEFDTAEERDEFWDKIK